MNNYLIFVLEVRSNWSSPVDYNESLMSPTNAIVKGSMMWNLWHGCHKLSPGCKHCYVYRGDAKRDIDSSVVTQTKNFDLPLRKKRNGDYKVPAGTLVYTCFTSDFFVEDADPWRSEAWQMMQQRSDLNFLIITKRIDRFAQCMPEDWNDGYNNVTICCTVENREANLARAITTG